jgi:benzodiazapine receptor
MNFLDSDDDPKRAERRALLFFLMLTLGVGAVASLFTAPSIPTWYAGLNHPPFAPPNWVFAPVWTALYIVMAFAAWRVWKKTGLRSLEMGAFGLQLMFNLAWSVIFFSLHRIGGALVDILLLNLTVFYTMLLFFRRDLLAGLLFLAYLTWLGYATFLNHALGQINT